MKTLKHLLFESGGINQELYINDIDQQYHGITDEVKQALFKQWDKVGYADWKILRYFNITMGDEDSAFNDVLDIIYPVLRIEWEGGIKGTSAYNLSNEWGSYRTDMPGVDGNDYEYRIIPVGHDFGFDQSVDFGDSGYSCWNIMVEFRPSSPNGVILWNGLIIGEDLFDKMNYPLQSYRGYDSEEMDLLEDVWDQDQSGSDTLFDYFRSFCQVGVKVY